MNNKFIFAVLICIGLLMAFTGPVAALVILDPPDVLPNYPDLFPDLTSQATWPVYAPLANAYVRCLVGIQGNVKSSSVWDDGTLLGRGDKVRDATGTLHDWGVSGRYGITTVTGDPDIPGSAGMPLTFCGHIPCHYFGYWKLKIGNDMRMIGGPNGSWSSEGHGGPILTPTTYDAPPADLAFKEPALGRMGPFIRGIWTTKSANGSDILTEIRIHLVRDMVKFEYRLTNKGTVAEKVGFEQNGDVETGYPIHLASEDGGYYGPYDNLCSMFIPGVGVAKIEADQNAMRFGGSEIVNGKTVPRRPVPDWVQYYDDVSSPTHSALNILNQEDATKPDFMAIGDYNDLYHRDLWIGDVWTGKVLSNDYHPDVYHPLRDVCWVLCWDQKNLRPGETRTIITYYGVGAASSRWTYTADKTAIPDGAVAAVEAPRSLQYNSMGLVPAGSELSPTRFSVKAWVYNLATDPGPFDLTDTTATISLPPGLVLVDPTIVPGNTEEKTIGPGNTEEKTIGPVTSTRRNNIRKLSNLVPDLVLVDPTIVAGNTEEQTIGLVTSNSESLPVEWQVEATGEYSGELSIFVSFVDNGAPSGSNQWQQTVVRKIFVPAAKQSVFHSGWQLMSVPFNFNDSRVQTVFNLVGSYGAKYWNPKINNYSPVTQIKSGQGFWMHAGLFNWGETDPFVLPSTAAIVGEASGTGTQVVTQSIELSKGWNMIGNPFVYPIYWGQVLVYSKTSGGYSPTLDNAVRNRWLSATLFLYNPDKGGYETMSSKESLLEPWKGYYVYAYQPVTLLLRAPVLPGGDVKANPGGQ